MDKRSRQLIAFAAFSAVGLIFSAAPVSAQDKGSSVSARESSTSQAESTSKNAPSLQGGSKNATSQSSNANGGEDRSTSAASADKDGAKNRKSATNATGKLPPGHPVVGYLMVPIAAPESKEWMKKGCWAKFHDGENYSGDVLTLMGPVDMPDMQGPFGIDWKGKISSVETGPKARVMVYDNENYKDLVATFKPGQKTKEISKKMGFFDEFSSLKILCPGV